LPRSLSSLDFTFLSIALSHEIISAILLPLTNFAHAI
jgi:hypothetical protein